MTMARDKVTVRVSSSFRVKLGLQLAYLRGFFWRIFPKKCARNPPEKSTGKIPSNNFSGGFPGEIHIRRVLLAIIIIQFIHTLGHSQ